MKRISVLLVALATTAVALADVAQVPVKELVLDNGMRFLMVERHHNPTVTAGWVAHVGSANETYGLTGMAHLFEHMMFKGTKTVGTTNYEKEKEIMLKLDKIREEMEKEYSKLRRMKMEGKLEGSIYDPENRTERLKELWAEMKRLQEEQHKYIVKDEFDEIYTGQGASIVNAFTNQDMTVFFCTVPSNKLELWFWMESERLLNPVFREFYSERDVVREERRLRTESDPVAKFEEQFEAMFWLSTPYHHPIIGWPSDVEAIMRPEADRFFATYYAPNNITAVLVGDFDPKQVEKLARKYFGRIPRGKVEPPEVITEEVEQLAERRMNAYADTNPSVELAWHCPAILHKDVPALQVLSGVLSGRSGRLFKSLVEEKKIATGEPYAFFYPMKYAGAFYLGAELAEGATHQQVEDALIAELRKLAEEPISDRELEKVKNWVLAGSFRKLRSNFYLALQLLIYDGRGDYKLINEGPKQVMAVTKEDVMRVAKRYFPDEGLNALWFFRKEGTQEDPEVAALPAELKPIAKKMLAQIEQIDDPAALQQLVSQLESQMDQAPEKIRPVMELVLKRAKKRMEQLSEKKED